MVAEAGGCSGNAGRDPEAADWASVTIDTPLEPAALRAFLDDIERLFRINPLLEFRAFEPLGGNRYRLGVLNLANAREIDVEIAVRPGADAVAVSYGSGLKTSTTFHVQPHESAARLILREAYGGSEAERRARIEEVDTSLNAWGRALHEYFRHWARWSWLPPWRWYIMRVWQPMRPSARRIVYMIWVISLVEMIALVVIGGLLVALGGLSPTR